MLPEAHAMSGHGDDGARTVDYILTEIEFDKESDAKINGK